MFVFVFCAIFAELCFCKITCDPEPGKPILTPMGKGKGIHPGRVSWNFDSTCSKWDGSSLFYWNSSYTNQTVSDSLLEGVVKNIGDSEDLKSSWDNIFKYFNKMQHGKSEGYKKGEKIALKLNFNVELGYTPKTNELTISPQFFKSLLRQLVYFAGVDEKDIFAYDAARWFQTQYWEGTTGIGNEFPEVNLVDNIGGFSWTQLVEPDMKTMFYFSNKKVQAFDKTKLPTILTGAKYLIVVNAFRGHDLAGITATGKNFFGSIYRDISCGNPHPGLWCPASIHEWVNITGERVPVEGTPWGEIRVMGEYNVLVDLLGHDDTANGKGLLFLTDGLYAGIAEEPPYDCPITFDIPPFNGGYTCSVFGSQDPIAMDSVLFDFLRSEKKEIYALFGCSDNYLHESALANDPPSQTQYQPSGHPIESLGVHEHWNSVEEKMYSRNLGKTEGIELVQVHKL